MKKILLIGGVTIDYIATSNNKLLHYVANNGLLSISIGGVMYNIAYNLSKLGNKITFITALGNDYYGSVVREHLKKNGINFTSPKIKYPTGSYVAINNSNHDMDVSICDNRAIGEISIKFLKQNKKLIEKFDYIVVDGNLSQETINYITSVYKNKKIFCDPISPQLAMKYKNVLNTLYLIKCNIHEARALVGNSNLEKEKLIEALFKIGLNNIIVSNGANDIYYGLNGNEINRYHVHRIKKFKNTTGCGDALFSGAIHYLSLGKSLKSGVMFGNKLAALTLNSEAATSEEVKKYAIK